MSVLSQRVGNVKPSPTLAVDAKAKALKAAGKDVVNLGSGEPDFDTPKHIKKAAIKAIKEGFTKYTPAPGTPELKNAVIAKLKKDHGLEYTPDQVIVTVGGKQAFYNMAQAMLNAGDEVIIPAPYWVSYTDMTILAEGKPVIVDTAEERGFKMTPAELEAAITPQTKMVVFNSPSNPTGAAYSRDELAALGAVLEKYPHVFPVVDDIYEKIIYDGVKFTTLLEVAPSLYDRTIVLNGVSKAYAMTGWRIGYAAGPKEVIKAMGIIQSQSTSNACSIAQRAAQEALNGPQKCIKPMLKAFHERRNFVVKRLNAMPGVHCFNPQGAFYVYPGVEGLMGKSTPEGKVIHSTLELADYLLESHNVAVVPGVAFGKDPYLRLSFATSMEDLKKAMDRIETAAKLLTGTK
ncbi:MAG: pyridoxal phosphate-dependent aminotransferase [Magnetococcales bacterium]|nr:pyridoxal phosphate-dependent aminotransferase [Magnetococcales bacterium]